VLLPTILADSHRQISDLQISQFGEDVSANIQQSSTSDAMPT